MMRITQDTLRKIIREEVEAVVSEAKPRTYYIGKKVKKDGKLGRVAAMRDGVLSIQFKDGTQVRTRVDSPGLEILDEDATQPRFNALQNAAADILNALGKRRASLSIAQREELPNLAARVVDGEMTVKSAAKKLGASIREAAHEPAGELVHRANPNFSVYEIVKGAGVTYGGDREGYRSKTLSKVGEFELYRGDESMGTFSSLPAAKQQIAALSSRRR